MPYMKVHVVIYIIIYEKLVRVVDHLKSVLCTLNEEPERTLRHRIYRNRPSQQRTTCTRHDTQ